MMPTFTQSAPGPVYSRSQLVFAGLASLTLWGVFTFVQTVRHRDYFLPPGVDLAEDAHAAPPTGKQAITSLALLFVSLVSVVGLAKVLSPRIEAAVAEGSTMVRVGSALFGARPPRPRPDGTDPVG